MDARGDATRQNGVEPKDLFYVSCFILHIPQVEAHSKRVLLQQTSERDRSLWWRKSRKAREIGWRCEGSWCWGSHLIALGKETEKQEGRFVYGILQPCVHTSMQNFEQSATGQGSTPPGRWPRALWTSHSSTYE